MLSIKNLSLKYEGRIILDNINLNAEKGEILVLTGCSGSGKSSLIKLLNGIIPEMEEAHVQGEITFDDVPMLNQDISSRSEFISTVFQNPKTQFYCINSTDELAFALENRNIPKLQIEDIIAKYTTILNTGHLLDKNLFSLSGGEKQLIAITSVACMNNEIYLFDEPSASLDKYSIELLNSALVKLKNMGKIIIIAEHRLYYLKDIMDKLAILDAGKLHIFEHGFSDKLFLASLVQKHNLRSFYEIKKADLNPFGITKISLCGQNTNSNSEKAVLECKKLDLAYEDEQILNMELSFCDGIYFIIGANGVGKSSFVKALSNLVKCERESFYKGEQIKHPYKFISMVMQNVNYQIFTESVWSEISIVSDDESKKIQVLKELDLYDKRDMHPQVLSGGEKQRLMIALAKVSDKPIVIFDEPTSGLCKKQMLQIVSYLRQMYADGKLVIVITHDYELIRECGGKIYEFIR